MRLKQVRLFLAVTFLVLLSLVACNVDNNEQHRDDGRGKNEETDETTATINEAAKEVLVSLKNQSQQIVATATLTENKDGVQIKLKGEKLPPGKHGFHIHETGSCEAPDFSSAGGHYNPNHAKHGKKISGGPHAGDLPNIEVNQDGTVQTEVIANLVTLEQGESHSLFKKGGTALVIHAKEDDYKSQPAGDAGERIACGVIE
ncbi:superoxide dismutase family protein [Cerasibacillus sp. JNUCC 74]